MGGIGDRSKGLGADFLEPFFVVAISVVVIFRGMIAVFAHPAHRHWTAIVQAREVAVALYLAVLIIQEK